MRLGVKNGSILMGVIGCFDDVGFRFLT